MPKVAAGKEHLLGPVAYSPRVRCRAIKLYRDKLGFPNLGVSFLGVPIVRIIVFWGYIRVP